MLPLWIDYSHLEKIPAAFYWSRNLLFEGGRIQGIQGNANLLAMVALLGLILFVVRLIARKGSPIWNTVWVVVAVGTLALTRSSTVIIATVAVALVAVFVRAGPPRRTAGRASSSRSPGIVRRGRRRSSVAILARAPAARAARQERRPHQPARHLGSRSPSSRVQRPVAGWGWVSWWVPWVEPFDDLAVFRGVTYLQAHNAWVDVFLQLGILGLIVMLALVLSTLMRSWLVATDTDPVRAGRRSLEWPTTIVPFLMLVALLVQSLTESRLLIEIGWSLLVIIAIKTSWRDAEGVDRRKRMTRRRPRRGSRRPFLGLLRSPRLSSALAIAGIGLAATTFLAVRLDRLGRPDRRPRARSSCSWCSC